MVVFLIVEGRSGLRRQVGRCSGRNVVGEPVPRFLVVPKQVLSFRGGADGSVQLPGDLPAGAVFQGDQVYVDVRPVGPDIRAHIRAVIQGEGPGGGPAVHQDDVIEEGGRQRDDPLRPLRVDDGGVGLLDRAVEVLFLLGRRVRGVPVPDVYARRLEIDDRGVFRRPDGGDADEDPLPVAGEIGGGILVEGPAVGPGHLRALGDGFAGSARCQVRQGKGEAPVAGLVRVERGREGQPDALVVEDRRPVFLGPAGEGVPLSRLQQRDDRLRGGVFLVFFRGEGQCPSVVRKDELVGSAQGVGLVGGRIEQDDAGDAASLPVGGIFVFLPGGLIGDERHCVEAGGERFCAR